MKMIHFSSDYQKLWNQRKAKLIFVKVVRLERLSKDFLEYDTKINQKEEYYKLSKEGKMIQLTFLGDKEIPFCTLRRYTPERYANYLKNIGKVFTIKIGEEK